MLCFIQTVWVSLYLMLTHDHLWLDELLPYMARAKRMDNLIEHCLQDDDCRFSVHSAFQIADKTLNVGAVQLGIKLRRQRAQTSENQCKL